MQRTTVSRSTLRLFSVILFASTLLSSVRTDAVSSVRAHLLPGEQSHPR
jgi:hypothetical protein